MCGYRFVQGVDSSPSDLDSSSPSVAASILPAIVTTQEDGSVQDEGEGRSLY